MSWWRKLFGRGQRSASAERDAPRSAPGPAPWREAGETRFDARVLDLISVTGELMAFSADPKCAARAASWGHSIGDELEARRLDGAPGIACALRYPVAPILPDGLLFTPSDMDEKWVLALRGDQILIARSWTGEVAILARATRGSGEVMIERLALAEDSGFEVLGDPVPIVDWMIRTFALGEILPLPVSADGARFLERSPVSAFSMFGHAAACAAISWRPDAPGRPLRADGAVMRAVQKQDEDELRRLVARGESLEAPSPRGGVTPLCVAALRGDLCMTHLLLELGSNPMTRDDLQMFAMGHAIVHGADFDVLEALTAAGTDLHAVNEHGFGLLHAAAESGRADAVPWLVTRGVSLEARTGRGHTALQIASGLGKTDAVEALLAAGAERNASSPDGTALEIATREKHSAVIDRLSRD